LEKRRPRHSRLSSRYGRLRAASVPHSQSNQPSCSPRPPQQIRPVPAIAIGEGPTIPEVVSVNCYEHQWAGHCRKSFSCRESTTTRVAFLEPLSVQRPCAARAQARLFVAKHYHGIKSTWSQQRWSRPNGPGADVGQRSSGPMGRRG